MSPIALLRVLTYLVLAFLTFRRYQRRVGIRRHLPDAMPADYAVWFTGRLTWTAIWWLYVLVICLEFLALLPRR